MSQLTNEEQKERVRQRIRAAVDPESYEYTPEKIKTDYVRTDEFQRVVIYARVSTDRAAQTSSFELQKKYYEDFVSRYPNWVMQKIYADEGKSGTTTRHRDQFNEMMDDAMKGEFDLIIVKNISRLARNVEDFLRTVKILADRRIGILFESEAIYSLNKNSRMALSFQATMAEEESRVRSRSMETSLRMRLDHGLPLTPELLGFLKDEDGKLIKNPETYRIPKLMFYMYIYGYSTRQIADVLTKLSKKTYLGNMKWTAGGVASTLRNERYCGDVRTRKRFKLFAADVVDQKTFKNRGEKPQSYYKGEHEWIVTRDDFIAVQRIMNNARYGGTSLLPELKVIPEGLLKGFVIVHPKWASFTAEDYLKACESVSDTEEIPAEGTDSGAGDISVAQEAGAFDLRGYEVADYKLFDENRMPCVAFTPKEVRFNAACIKKMKCGEYIELLIHPKKKQVAIRPTKKDNRYAIRWSKGSKEEVKAVNISCRAYIDRIFELFDWKRDYKYKLYGCVYRDGKNAACIFSDIDSVVYIKQEDYLATGGVEATGQNLLHPGSRICAVPGGLGGSFGNEYYVEKSLRELKDLTSEQWRTRMDGRICNTGDRLKVTSYEELREFIKEELGELFEENEIGEDASMTGAGPQASGI